MTWKRLCGRSELEQNELREIEIDGVVVLVLRRKEDVFAYPPLCPHMESQLIFGTCDGEYITCMQHLWQWTVTGESVGLAEEPLLRYPTRIEGDDVLIQIDRELKYAYQG
jgi:toluene monooxygenase system ferredoxin subunit